MPERRHLSLELRLVLACAVVALAAAALVTAAVVPAMARWMDEVEPGQRGDLLLGWVGVPALFAVTGAAAVGWWVGSVLVRPLRRLTTVVQRMAAGDRAVRVGDVPGREPAELGRAIDTMADALVRQEAARQQMVDDVAHELRTPLAALQAGLEELRDGLVEPDAATLAALHDQSQRLGRVVADLGDLAAAEASAPSLRRAPLDLADLAAAVLRDKLPVLRAAGVAPSSSLAPAATVGDAGRLYQVLGNVLDNVARYCPDGSTVTVTSGVQDGAAVLRVEDTGPGIPPGDLPHVTRRLYRGSNAAGVAGSGIGLAVARELVAAHGGRLTVGPGTGGLGTRVELRLPLLDRSGLTGARGAGAGPRR